MKFNIIIIFSFLIAPTLSMLNKYLEIDLIRSNIIFINNIQKYQFALALFLFSLAWIIGFYSHKKESKKEYSLNDTAGILGVFTALASVSGLMFFEHWFFSVLFSISGTLCIYCISVPAYDWFASKIRRKKFEIGFLSFFFGSITLYLIDGYSNVFINSIFGINEQYFRFSKPIAMALVSTPFLACISFFLFFYFIARSSKNATGSDKFYSLNKISACYIVLVLSIAFGSKATTAIEIVAGKFDFDDSTICKGNIEQKGVIILDPAHTKALVKTIEKNKNLYAIRSCNPPKESHI